MIIVFLLPISITVRPCLCLSGSSYIPITAVMERGVSLCASSASYTITSSSAGRHISGSFFTPSALQYLSTYSTTASNCDLDCSEFSSLCLYTKFFFPEKSSSYISNGVSSSPFMLSGLPEYPDWNNSNISLFPTCK